MKAPPGEGEVQEPIAPAACAGVKERLHGGLSSKTNTKKKHRKGPTSSMTKLLLQVLDETGLDLGFLPNLPRAYHGLRNNRPTTISEGASSVTESAVVPSDHTGGGGTTGAAGVDMALRALLTAENRALLQALQNMRSRSSEEGGDRLESAFDSHLAHRTPLAKELRQQANPREGAKELHSRLLNIAGHIRTCHRAVLTKVVQEVAEAEQRFLLGQDCGPHVQALERLATRSYSVLNRDTGGEGAYTSPPPPSPPSSPPSPPLADLDSRPPVPGPSYFYPLDEDGEAAVRDHEVVGVAEYQEGATQVVPRVGELDALSISLPPPSAALDGMTLTTSVQEGGQEGTVVEGGREDDGDDDEEEGEEEEGEEENDTGTAWAPLSSKLWRDIAKREGRAYVRKVLRRMIKGRPAAVAASLTPAVRASIADGALAEVEYVSMIKLVYGDDDANDCNGKDQQGSQEEEAAARIRNACQQVLAFPGVNKEIPALVALYLTYMEELAAAGEGSAQSQRHHDDEGKEKEEGEGAER